MDRRTDREPITKSPLFFINSIVRKPWRDIFTYYLLLITYYLLLITYHLLLITYYLLLITYYLLLIISPGCVAQSLTCLATDASLIADPGVASSIPARFHTFVEIDHGIIFYGHPPPFR